MRTRLFAAALAVFAAVPMFAAPSRFGSIVESFGNLQQNGIAYAMALRSMG